LESLLEEAHIKLSSLVSDLLGVSARRMLKALADGETDPAALAASADQRLRATQAQLHDALGADPAADLAIIGMRYHSRCKCPTTSTRTSAALGSLADVACAAVAQRPAAKQRYGQEVRSDQNGN